MATRVRRGRPTTASAGPSASSDGAGPEQSGLVVLDADLSLAEPFQFVWRLRILLGYLNLLIGEEKVGKGTLMAWVAAMVTRGTLPGDLYGTPRTVLFVGDEDSWRDIWVPRLAAAGADLADCKYIKGLEGGDVLDVRKHADNLRIEVRQRKAALVYFDQLLDNLGVTDNWKDSEVRRALAPLRRVAHEEQVGIVFTLHPNKRKGTVRERVSGSPAFHALSRRSMFLVRHPFESGRVAYVSGGGNYGADPQTFEFALEGAEVTGKEGKRVETSRIADWRETALDKDIALDYTPGRGTRQDEVKAWLMEFFADGKPIAATVVAEAGKEEGYTLPQLHRARRDLGMIADKQKGVRDGKWTWYPVGMVPPRVPPRTRARGGGK